MLLCATLLAVVAPAAPAPDPGHARAEEGRPDHQARGPAGRRALPLERSARRPRHRHARREAGPGLHRRPLRGNGASARGARRVVVPADGGGGHPEQGTRDGAGHPGWGGRRPALLRRLRRVLRHRSHRVAPLQRRDRLRGLRHRGPGIPMGRLQGRRPQGQGPPRDEQRSRERRPAVRGQDPALLRPLALQVRAGGASRGGGSHRDPHDGFGRIQVAGGADLEHRGGGEPPCRRRTPPSREGMGHRGSLPQDRGPGRPGPRRPAGRRREAGLQARSPRGDREPRSAERGAAEAKRQRSRQDPGQRPRPGPGGRPLHGPPRPPRQEGRRQGRRGCDLQRRPRQRLGRGHASSPWPRP